MFKCTKVDVILISLFIKLEMEGHVEHIALLDIILSAVFCILLHILSNEFSDILCIKKICILCTVCILHFKKYLVGCPSCSSVFGQM